MRNKNKGTRVYVTLPSYLRRLRAEENRKPEEERLDVPTMKTLAEMAGIKPATLSSIVTRRTRSLNLDVAASIIDEMRRRGFNTQITDILRLEMEEDLNHLSARANDLWVPPPPPLTRRQRLKYPGEEFVNAYAEGSEGGASSADTSPIQPEMLPEVTEVVRMLTSFPESIQKDAALALKGQLELVQKTFSFHDQLLLGD